MLNAKQPLASKVAGRATIATAFIRKDGSMLDMKERAKRGLAVFASGYAKRIMRSQYDRLTKTEFGQKLHGLDKTYRYGIEAGLHALGAVIEQVLPEDIPAVMFFKQILEDAPAEIAGRLINGVRGDLGLAVQNAKTLEERMAIMSLLELDDASLKELLRWFGSMDSSERTRAADVVCKLAYGERQLMSKLTPEERNTLVDIENPPSPPPKENELRKEVMSDMQKARQSLQQRRNELRDKRRAKSHA